jgi:hypothetical protein
MKESKTQKIDAGVRTLLSVSREEIQKHNRNGNANERRKSGLRLRPETLGGVNYIIALI